MLGFAKDQKFSVRELRDAYFAAAKLCHPDTVRGDDAANTSTLDFRDVTDAYEHLLNCDDNGQYSKEDLENIITISEDEEYFAEELDVEIVDESDPATDGVVKRPKLPSWDDIMFGGSKTEDQ